ncbi:hypothetical protein [Paractinoplanes toevensis]|nr:hypothetical protein [Actinoplanes toevensis]
MFDAIGSAEKELIAMPGHHAENRPSAVARWRDFITQHLGSNDSAH